MFSLEKEDIFQQQLQDAAFGGQNRLRSSHLPAHRPLPLLSQYSPLLSSIPPVLLPQLAPNSVFLALKPALRSGDARPCSGREDGCRLSLLKSNKTSRRVQRFRFFKSPFKLAKLRRFFACKSETLHKTPASILCNSFAWGRKRNLTKTSNRAKSLDRRPGISHPKLLKAENTMRWVRSPQYQAMIAALVQIKHRFT